MLELASVDQPGQRVVAGLVGQLGGVLALAADVAQHQHDAGDAARSGRGSARPSGRSRSPRRRCAAAAMLVADLDRCAPRCSTRSIGLGRRAPAALRPPAGTAPGRQALGVVQRPAASASSATGFRYSTQPSMSVVMTASPIDASVTCARSFSANSSRRGELAVGDVGQRARHAHRAARGVAHRLAAGAEPAVLAGLAVAAGTRRRTARRAAGAR